MVMDQGFNSENIKDYTCFGLNFNFVPVYTCFRQTLQLGSTVSLELKIKLLGEKNTIVDHPNYLFGLN